MCGILVCVVLCGWLVYGYVWSSGVGVWYIGVCSWVWVCMGGAVYVCVLVCVGGWFMGVCGVVV